VNAFDVLIVGARCAGASLAILLGQLGYRVCLIDRATFPSDTLSTHVFGDWAAFGRLGVTEAIRASGAPPITRFRVDINGIVLEAPIVVTPWVSGLRRIKLDQILLDKVRQYPTVDWRPGCELVSLVYEGNRVTGAVVRRGRRIEQIDAAVVVGADGRHSLTARLTCAPAYLSFSPPRCAYYAYLEGFTPLPVPTFEFHWRGENLILTFPTDEDLQCVVVLPPQSEFSVWRKAPQVHFEAAIASDTALAPRMRGVRRIHAVRGTGTLRSYLRQPFGPGWALVGDAGAAIHPCIGAGMDHAVVSAEFLADALHRFFSGAEPWEQAMEEYRSRRDRRIRPTLEFAVHLGSLGSPDPHSSRWLALVSTMPGLAHQLASRAPEVVSSLVGEERARHLESLFEEAVVSHA